MTAIESTFFFLFFLFLYYQRGYAFSMGTELGHGIFDHSTLDVARFRENLGYLEKPIRISTCNKMHLRCNLYLFDGSLGFEFHDFAVGTESISLKRLMGCGIGGIERAPPIFKRLNIYIRFCKIFEYLFLF